MKTQLFTRCSCGLILAALPWMGGCAQQTGAETPDLVSLAMTDATNPVATTEEASPLPAATEPAAPAAPLSGVDDAPPVVVPAPSTGTVLPPNIRPSSPLADVVKMAQSGVDEVVMLTFITNASGTFSLGSEEIIYLNDLGVSNELITAMMQRDQNNKQFWASNAQAQAVASAPAATEVPAEPVEAAAPSYVEAPQAAPAEPQPVITSNDYFYDTLSPYGTWVNVEGYGLCWQPTVVVVNRHWQPYSDRGRWIYTDAGWYWLSDYSWGWATFHYGRWFQHARWGWCWWPDRVWAPSWVTWRYSGDYCGWAPLPPAAIYRPGFGFSYYGRSVGFGFDFGIAASWYTFVPVSRFCDPRPYRYRLPGHHVTKIYHNTTVINNYGSGNRNTVINRGIAPERISAVTKTEIRPVALRDSAHGTGRVGRGERLEQDGRSLVVRRPHFPESSGEVRSAAATGRTPSQPVAGRTEGFRSHVNRPSEGAAMHDPREGLRSPRSGSNLESTRPRTPVTTMETPQRDTPRIQSPGISAPLRPATPPVAATTPPAGNSPRVSPGSSRGESVADRERPTVQRPAQPSPGRSIDRPTQAVPSKPAPAPTAPRAQVQTTPAIPAAPTRTSSSPVVIGRQDRQAPTVSRSTPAASMAGSTGSQIGSTRPSTTDTWSSRQQPQASRSDVMRIPSSNSRPTYSPPTAPAPVQRSWTPPAPSSRTTIAPPQVNRTPSFSPPPTAAARPQPAAPAMSAPRAPSVSPAPVAPAPRVQASPPPSSRSGPTAPSRSDSGSRGRDRR
ncbi:MAG: hypothetical protein KIS67_12760 [Verrucomicrobiae bacterium]|nr:hypothetical protein [Verrucomicrobiae bacterium]